MPEFTVRVISGATVTPWVDPQYAAAYVQPAGALAPTRINARPEQQLKYWRNTGSNLVLGVTLGGVDRPLDATLAGRLFVWSWSERQSPAPIITPTINKSSEVTISFSPKVPGHYLLLCWRDGSGAVAVPFDVE